MTNPTPPSDSNTAEEQALEAIDWANFQFPPRAGVRSTQELLSGGARRPTISRAPTWAAPPILVDTWHLDRERWILSHPGQRKKVELLRITSRRRLAMVADMVAQQPNDRDQAGLRRGLSQAIHLVFGIGLGEMLAMGPDHWEWPVNVGKGGQSGGGDHPDDDTPQDGQRRRMGFNGF